MNKSISSVCYHSNFWKSRAPIGRLFTQMTCKCDNSCLLKDKDPKELSKQMPAWIPIKGGTYKNTPKAPLCGLSAINQGAVSGILEMRCYQRCPIYTHTTASLISAEITDPL